MIYRAEPQTLMIFNSDKGITAALSGKELLKLKSYLLEGYRDEFISRLYELELLPPNIEEEGKRIIDKIKKTDNITSPPRSFFAPESIHIDVTTCCPLNCVQCYKDTLKNKEMTFEEFVNFIDQAKKLGVFQIAIGGGEPLLVRNLHKYVEYVRLSGMACTLTTSGHGLTLDGLKAFHKAGVNHIQVSLNGSTKEIHSYSRDGFDDGIRALKLLSENRVPFGINWVARMDNVYDFNNMIVLAKELGADNINILRYKPSEMENYNKVVLTKEAFEFLCYSIKAIQGLKLKVDSAFSNLLNKVYSDKVGALNSGCGAGRRFMIIDAYGRLKPCSHMLSVSEEKDIMQYWHTSEELLMLRQGEELIGGQCQSCKNLNACRGCRAICERLYGDINAGEQDCSSYIKKELI